MAASTQETARVTREDVKEAKDAKSSGGAASDEKDGAKADQPRPAGGLKPWLPLIIAVVGMPVLAFVMTRFVLLPKLEHAIAQSNGAAAPEAAAESASPAAKEGAKPGAPGKVKIMVPLSKMLVNVSGTMGTRYLMTSITLVGNTPDFKAKVEDNKDQLMDLATGALSTKTISDLEKPGARNVIRSELITVLNNALGGSLVQEIYITELAIQ
jgi:flagellar FliL protein